jgi:hypothetical protein
LPHLLPDQRGENGGEIDLANSIERPAEQFACESRRKRIVAQPSG